MWMSSEDARSDFVLAAAGMMLGTMVVRFLQGLALYPGGILSAVLTIVWIVLLNIVVARFFVEYRGQGLAGYGLREDRTGLAEGVLIAAPLAIAGYVRGIEPYGAVGALLGRAGGAVSGPTVESTDPIDLLFGLLVIGLGALGAMMMYGLLTTRARDAFRSPDMPLVEALRTFGLGAVALSTVLGLLLGIGSGRALTSPLFDGVALAATVLLADRAVAKDDRTTRATVLAPAIAAIVAAVVIVGGGLFGSGLALALWLGTAAAAVVVVVATLIETRRAAWAAVPLVVVAMWSPTCTGLPIGGYGIGGCF